MKIYILPVAEQFRPAHGFIAPAHNSDFGVENDFERWLREHPEYLTWNPDEADWMYAPFYFNRFYCQYWGAHTDELQNEILKLVSRNRPTFAVCEYDIQVLQSHLDLCGMTIFTASRQGDKGIDIPLLCSPHQEVELPEKRQWLASFMGKFETSDYRGRMVDVLQHRLGGPDITLLSSRDTKSYVELMANSYIALAPRGHGGQSFRFYEAMQFECVPFLIGDIDTRPFKQWIEWDTCSFYTNDVNKIDETLRGYTIGALRWMGVAARQWWLNELHYGKWCKYVIKSLQDL